MSASSSKNKRKTSELSSLDIRLLGVRLAKAIGVSTWVVVSFFGGAFISVLILIFLIKLGVPYLSLAEPVRSTIEAALAFALSTFMALYIPKLVFKRRLRRDWLGIARQLQWKDLLLGVLGFIPYIFFAMIAIALVHSVIPFNLYQAQEVGFSRIATSAEYILAFLTLVVVAPIAEELLFRGYLYGRLRRWLGIIASSLIVSVIFGALHGQWNVGVNVFGLSLVLCGLREYTGSIWAGVVLHMFKNAIAFYGLFIVHL